MKAKAATLAVVVAVLFGLLPIVLMRAGDFRHPYITDLNVRFHPPQFAHPFGTDDLGRDLLARTLLATGLSLSVAGRAFVIALVLAIILGTIAGLAKDRWPDRVISYVIALIFTVPFILLAVALAAVLRADIGLIFIIIGCIAWAPPARLVRAEVVRLREARFIVAQRAYGLAPSSIFLRSMFPMVLLPPFISLLFLTPELVGIDVGLSYFGLGAQPPTPTVGRLIFDGLNFLRSAWWVPVLPTVVLVAFFFVLYSLLNRLRPTFVRAS